jgi:hypothetical protein
LWRGIKYNLIGKEWRTSLKRKNDLKFIFQSFKNKTKHNSEIANDEYDERVNFFGQRYQNPKK